MEEDKDKKPAEEKKVYGRVYGITNKIDGKRYVGQTIKKISYRFNEHARANSPLGEAMRQYGRENFELVELEKCYSFEELNEAEKKWIKEWDCKEPNGYNRTDGGDGVLNPVKGTREKMAKASTGNQYALGRKHTEEEIERIRNSNLGKKRTPETCENVRKAKLGTKLSQSTKDNMSKSRKGKKFTQEHKDNLSKSRLAYWEKIPKEDRKQTEEHIAKRFATIAANREKRKAEEKAAKEDLQTTLKFE